MKLQEIKRVAILGAGAMSAFFATRFFDTPGFSTAVVARGARYGRLNSQGLVVNGRLERSESPQVP